MISKEQFQIIIDRHKLNPITKSKSKVSDEHNEIRVCENDFIITEDNFHLLLSVPNKKRFTKKILEA